MQALAAAGGMLPHAWWQWAIGGALTIGAVVDEFYIKPRRERKDAADKAARARLLTGVRLGARDR